MACATHAIRYDSIIPLSEVEDRVEQSGGGEGERGGGDGEGTTRSQRLVWRHAILDGPLRTLARRMNLSTVHELEYWLTGRGENPREKQRSGQVVSDVLRHYSKVQSMHTCSPCIGEVHAYLQSMHWCSPCIGAVHALVQFMHSCSPCISAVDA